MFVLECEQCCRWKTFGQRRDMRSSSDLGLNSQKLRRLYWVFSPFEFNRNFDIFLGDSVSPVLASLMTISWLCSLLRAWRSVWTLYSTISLFKYAGELRVNAWTDIVHLQFKISLLDQIKHLLPRLENLKVGVAIERAMLHLRVTVAVAIYNLQLQLQFTICMRKVEF